MLRTSYIATALAIGALSLPALAGSWPNIPARKAQVASNTDCCAAKPAAKATRDTASRESPKAIGGFVYIGGEPGWTLAQHKFVLEGGRFVHSEECDHAIRTVKGPTPDETDSVKRFSPG